MLPFQVGAIDPNRLAVKRIHSQFRDGCGAGLSRHSFTQAEAHWRRRANRFYLLATLSLLLVLILGFAGSALAGKGEGKGKGGKKKKNLARASASGSPSAQSLANIPLPIGHEAKGLVLPDFDLEGRLRGKFVAGIARRIDQENVGFQDLKITTFTLENQHDLEIDMHTSVLNLKTRILSSQERTTIKRADFSITGDSLQFDTNARTGRLIGNVKMVINDQSHLMEKARQ